MTTFFQVYSPNTQEPDSFFFAVQITNRDEEKTKLLVHSTKSSSI
jgi:hypothetical protein